jgi:serine/threonine protein kinase
MSTLEVACNYFSGVIHSSSLFESINGIGFIYMDVASLLFAFLNCCPVKEEGYEEIRGEIEMLQQCNHPNVVRYFGSYQSEEYLWVCVELYTCLC